MGSSDLEVMGSSDLEVMGSSDLEVMGSPSSAALAVVQECTRGFLGNLVSRGTSGDASSSTTLALQRQGKLPQ